MGATAEMTSTSSSPVVAPDDSFTKRLVQPGTGLVRPNEGSTCTVLISQSGELELLDEALIGYPLGREATLCLGDGEGLMSDTIDACLETMLPGETCTMEVAVETMRKIVRKMQQMKSSKTDTPCNSHDAVADKPAALRIELRSFTRDKDIYEMTPEEKLDRAGRHKTKGTNCFGRGNAEEAERAYLRALKYILTIDPAEVEDAPAAISDRLNSLKCACHLNVAACQLKHQRYEHVVAHCTKALALDPGSVKGLFRRGIAHTELQEYERAAADLEEALRLAPTSKPVRQQRQALKERMKALDAKYARAMSKMFGGQ